MIELTSSANSKSPSNFRLHLASLTRTSSIVATNIQENRMALDPAGEHRPPWTNETRRRRANSRKTRAPSHDSTTKNNRICPRNDDRKTTLKRRARKLQHVLCYPLYPAKRKRTVRRSNELWLRELSWGDAALPQTRGRLLVGFRRMSKRDAGGCGRLPI